MKQQPFSIYYEKFGLAPALLNSAAAAVGEINRTDEGNSNQYQYGSQ